MKLVDADSRHTVIAPFRAMFDQGRAASGGTNLALIGRNGTETPVEVNLAPIRDTHERVAGGVIVFRDITQRKLIEKELRAAAIQLSRSNEDLQHFAHAISHDLQEPLRSIRAFSQMLHRRYQGQLDDEADRQLGYIEEGTGRMSRMIRDLLAYSRAVNTASNVITDIRLSDAVTWAERNLEERLRETNGTVRWQSLPVVKGDLVQLVQLFQNLISNALKFRSSEPPVVSIDASSSGEFWRICVKDNGEGIRTEERSRIFNLFERGETQVPGTGIGLAVCKRIVERHGGTIWVESEVGKGSTFHFTLAKDPQPVAELTPVRQGMSSED
jgi:light-regulated signal transduction histidine kinase (bacteriophytochrome)